MRYYYVNLQVDFKKSRKMPSRPDSQKEWNSAGYFQTFYCTEESKEKAKKLVYQYFLKNESDPSNCQIKYDHVAWMRSVTKLEELAHGMDSELTQQMFNSRDKIGIWYVGEKGYYVSEEDYCAEMEEESIEEFDIKDDIEAELSEIDDEFGDSYEGICQACDAYSSVDDMMLCNECASKLERDLIRQGEWDYSASAFGMSKDGREKLRNEVIKKYGKKLEVIAPKTEKKISRNRNKSKRRKNRKKISKN